MLFWLIWEDSLGGKTEHNQDIGVCTKLALYQLKESRVTVYFMSKFPHDLEDEIYLLCIFFKQNGQQDGKYLATATLSAIVSSRLSDLCCCPGVSDGRSLPVNIKNLFWVLMSEDVKILAWKFSYILNLQHNLIFPLLFPYVVFSVIMFTFLSKISIDGLSVPCHL